MIESCSRVGDRIDVNVDKIVLRSVTIGYILFLSGVLMSIVGYGQSPSYSLIARVLMTISMSVTMGAAGVLIWSKSRFF